MNRTRRSLSGLVLLAATLTSLPAWSDDPTKEQCISANEKAQDLRRTGKLREAKTALAVCVATSCPGPLREDCAQRISEIDQVMPAIVIEAKDNVGNDVARVRVTMDGQPLADKLNGSALALDPGEHKFVFRAEGKKKIERTWVIRERDKTRREKIVFEPETAAAPTETAPPATTNVAPMQWPQPATTPAQPATPATAAAPTAEAPPAGGTSAMPSTLVLVAGGVGVAGLALGIVTGLSASSKESALQSECNGNACPPSAQADLDDFHSSKTLSTIGWGVGFVGLGAAAAMYFLMPRQGRAGGAKTGVYVGPGSSGVVGRF